MTTVDAGRLATNWLLAALPPEEQATLLPHLDAVTLSIGQVLARSGEPITHAYFPLSGAISLLTPLEDAAAIEVGLVGREGMVGLPLVLGSDTARGSAICQLPGAALRLDAAALREQLAANPALRERLGGYTLFYLTQVAQVVACSRRHPVQQRCATWLVLAHDRVDGDQFPLTHRSLGAMLGVRRAGVTEAAGALQQLGAISYSSGWVTVRDRARLEAAACPCYRVVNDEYTRLLG